MYSHDGLIPANMATLPSIPINLNSMAIIFHDGRPINSFYAFGSIGPIKALLRMVIILVALLYICIK